MIFKGLKKIHKPIAILRKLCYNKDTESTDDGCSHKIDKNNRLMWKSGGYLFLL